MIQNAVRLSPQKYKNLEKSSKNTIKNSDTIYLLI